MAIESASLLTDCRVCSAIQVIVLLPSVARHIAEYAGAAKLLRTSLASAYGTNLLQWHLPGHQTSPDADPEALEAFHLLEQEFLAREPDWWSPDSWYDPTSPGIDPEGLEVSNLLEQEFLEGEQDRWSPESWYDPSEFGN